MVERNYKNPIEEFNLTIEEYGEYQRYVRECLEKGLPYHDLEGWAKIHCKGKYFRDLEKDKIKKKWLEKKNHTKELRDYILENYGSFSFSHYDELLSRNIEEQYIIRFLYLCTYLELNDTTNRIHYGKTNDGLATEKDLKEILKMDKKEKERTFERTKKAFIDYELIYINKDRTISVNSKYCTKGKIKDKDLLKESVKIMDEGIRDIYERATITEHKKLGLLIKLLPYINFNHNIICSNPTENDIEKIIPLNMKELCNKVGYNPTNSNRLKRDLFALTVNGELVVKITETGKAKFITINPRVYYKGTDKDKLKAIGDEFKVRKD